MRIVTLCVLQICYKLSVSFLDIMKGGVALEDRERDGETPPMKKMKMTDYFTTDRDDKENGENVVERMKESEVRSNGVEIKLKEEDQKEKSSEDKYKIPKVVKMRMTDSLPKGCE